MRWFIMAAIVSTASVSSAASCPDSLPFPLPSAKVSANWGDIDYTQWANAEWEKYCNPQHKSPLLAAAIKLKRAKRCACKDESAY